MGLFSDLREVWRETDPLNYRTLSGRVYNLEDYTSWGNNMYFLNFDERRIVGWINPFGEPGQPRINDEVRTRMESGRVLRFIVVEVEHMSDPRDMFYATVEDIGYLGEPLSNKWVLEAKL